MRSPLSAPDEDTLRALAAQARCLALSMIFHAGSGHPGGSLSALDVLVALYARVLRIQLATPPPEDRDRFVLSKGHAAPALYAILAMSGFFPWEEMGRFRTAGSPLQGHPHVLDIPWVETSTGSLGQGFSVAAGMALGLRHQRVDAQVFSMLGDGEIQEGMVWETAMFASHYALTNLCAILDYNKMQSDDLNSSIMAIEPVADKWRAFGWHVLEIDGHDFGQILETLCHGRDSSRPTMVVAHTVKGKGVRMMEGSPLWHGSVSLRPDQLREALGDLGLDEKEIERHVSGAIWKKRPA